VIPKETWYKLLEFATQAPSGDNGQPWRFVVQDDVLEIYNVPGKDTSIYNYNQRGSMIAHGALIENLVIAGQELGFNTSVSAFPSVSEPDCIVRITLDKTEPKQHPLFAAIATRTTNRKKYDGSAITERERSALIQAGNGLLNLIEDKDRISKLARAISVNEIILFSNPVLHKHFFDYLRWNAKEEKLSGDGFFVKTLEVKAPTPVFKMMSHWSIMKLLRKLGIPNKIGSENEQVYASSSAVGFISIPGNQPRDYFEAGRVFERVWLTSTSLGLYIQPTTGVIYMHENLKFGYSGPLTPDEQSQVTDAYEVIRSISEIGARTIAVLFRIGRGEPPSAKAVRIPVSKLVEFS